MSQYRWCVMALIFVIFMVAQADRANIGFAIPFMQKEFDLTNTEVGIIISLFFAGYGFCQIPAGYLIRKTGIRFSYALGMILTSVFTFMMGRVDSVLHLKMLRTLIGVSEAPVVISSTVTINNWFPSKEKGTATGIFLAGSKFGPLLVPPICAWILLNYDWRHIFLFFSIPGIVLGVIWYLLVRNRPSESPFVNQQEADYINEVAPQSGEQKTASRLKARPFKFGLIDRLIRTRRLTQLQTSKEIFSSWDIYGAAMGYMCMVGIVDGVLMSWLPKYLLQEHNFNIVNSALLASAPFAGNVLGNLLGGWLSDNVFGKRRKPLMLVSAFCTIIMMGFMLVAPHNQLALGALLFCIGFLLSLGYSAYSVYAMGRASKECYPVAYAIINMGGQIGAVCMPLIVGVLLDSYSWNAVFIALAIAAAVCLTVVLTIREPLPAGASMPE
ncbi:MFS transporter [Leminorella grimontii]|uniref:MFS transporter n=2 Tax=Leminorella grimontii TaxID=82981 RepID=A0AAV5N1U3_9GAMM|nr:MFS transporter [Leminorella grimontii]GKX59526.1 MFS transporter [Leminorella grimontii]